MFDLMFVCFWMQCVWVIDGSLQGPLCKILREAALGLVSAELPYS